MPNVETQSSGTPPGELQVSHP